MSNEPTGSGQPATPEIPPTPTTTYFQQVADDFIHDLDRIVAALPALSTAHPTTAKFVRGHQTIPPEFLAAVVAAVEQTPVLQATQKFDTVAGRNALQMLEAFTPLVNRVAALHDALLFTMRSTKAWLGASGLQIYAVSKGLARDPGASVGSASITSHLAVMKRTLGRKGPRGPKAEPSPTTPQPPGNVLAA